VEPLSLYYHPDSLLHDTGEHPERIARMQAIARAIEADGLSRRAPLREPEAASAGQLTRIHATGYVATIDRIARGGGGRLDVDTVASSGSYQAAVRAAGGAIAATTAVVTGQAQRAFSIARPPGHHALADHAMGFCFFNNIAIAAREAQAVHRIGRIAIVDVDVHHGNGTQDAFADDPTILFASLHQFPFWPGSGALHETGVGAGIGATLNMPLPAGCGDPEYLAAIDRVVAPKVRAHRPELMLVSIGYDAHWADPLAQMRLSIAGYVAIVERLVALADELCDGRIALMLEGGYSLEALGHGVVATARSLLGDPWQDPLGPPPGPARDHVATLGPLLDAARQIHGLS
jgi:acetoin utilization deacetylase AcuC-like enzyme